MLFRSKMVNTLDNPPKLIGDYDRQIEKAHKRREDRLIKSSSASGNSVAQLGQQKNQSFPPLKVFSDYVLTGSGYAASEEGVDLEFVAEYGDAAWAHSMTISQYLLQLAVHTGDELKHKFQLGKPLVRPNEVKDLPAKNASSG